MNSVVRAVLIIFLIAAVVLEGYYIMVLRDRMRRNSEELRNISIQLQNLKIEREKLHEDFSAARKSVGEKKDEHTSEGKH